MRVGAILRADSPDYLNVRKGARAAIVAPLVLALGEVVFDNDALALYAVLASIVALVFADYGGPARQRTRAYLVMLVVPSGMIAVGAALSARPVLAVAGMFLIGFSASMASTLGGYTPLHVSGIALAYSLSVLQPLTDLGLVDRIVGWAIGVGASMVAALVLWPVDRRTGLRVHAADLCGAIAETLRAPDTELRDRMGDLRSRVEELQRRMAAPLRPFGAAARDIAYFHLVLHLEQAVDVVGDLVEQRPSLASDADPGIAAELTDGPLRVETAAGLDRARSILTRECSPDGEEAAVGRLARSLAEGRRRIEEIVARTEGDRARVATVEDSIPLRALSHLTIWIEFEAARTERGGRLPAPLLSVAPEVSSASPSDAPRSRLGRIRRRLGWELRSGSVVTKNSVRLGTGLAAAVALAELLPVQHGFWIVLATLLVLRSDAGSTSSTALVAVIGTVAGFIVIAAVLVLGGDSELVLWLLFPIAVFLSGYTPGAYGVGVGQATFALNVVILFTLTSAPGLPTAVVRVEDVTLGAVTAIVLSLVIWPRGARAVLARAVAGGYRAAARATDVFVDGTPEARAEAEQQLSVARRRAEEALDNALTEHGEPIALAEWTSVLRVLELPRALVVGLVPSVDATGGACDRAVTDAKARAQAVGQRFADVADALVSADGDALSGARAPAPTKDRDVKDVAPYEGCLGEGSADAGRRFDAIAVVAWAWFVQEIDRDLDLAGPNLRAVVAAADPHTWLVGPRT